MKRQDGMIKFIGRVKELIKSGGMNIAPQLVEAALLSHPQTAGRGSVLSASMTIGWVRPPSQSYA